VYNDGRASLAVSGSAVSLNVSGQDGGGLYNAYGGTLAVSGSTAYGNGAAGDGGGFYNGGTLTVTASTLALDSASGGGGGVYNTPFGGSAGAVTLAGSAVWGCGATAGGGVYSLNGTLALSNSTLAEDSALGDGGGLWVGGAAAGPVTLTNVTVALNRAALLGAAGRGGGVFVAAGLPAPPVLHNTLVAGNYEGAFQAVRDDVAGALSPASDYNLVGDGTGMTGISDGVSHDLVGSAAAPIEAGLGPLQDNGGPTLTIALLPGSPALRGGSTAYAADADQRGLARVVDGAIDIGAYQTQDYGL
jgi:hypothetical protein